MTHLLNEFNQDRINKIVAAFILDAHELKLPEYQADADWIKAAVMNIDHLRQNKVHLNRMQFIARNTFALASMRNYFASGEWQKMTYMIFLYLINSFEPSVQMRHIQHQYEKADVNERSLQQNPVVVQDDDHFLVMRAETPNAAIEARQRIEQATKQQYTWCISSKSSNLFYRYRVENNSIPITAYFVWDKTKSVDDAWHAFVLHIGRNTMMFTNASNKNPEIIAAHATSQHLQGIDASKLTVQPLTKQEKTFASNDVATGVFVRKSYDERTNFIQQRNKLSMIDYAILDKKQQHLYIHYLNPNKPENLIDAMRDIQNVFEPVLYMSARGLDIIHQASENSIEQLFQTNEPYTEFLKYTWSKETKEYYHIVAQRTINNAVEVMQQTYI